MPLRLYVMKGEGGRSGFTLIELITVILILSLFLTFASVKWDSFLKSGSESFLEKLSIEISLLRENAVSDYKLKAVEFDLANNTVSVGRIEDSTYNPLRQFQIGEEDLLRDIVINGEKISTGRAVVRFYPSGLVDKAILHLEDENRSFYSITIHPLTAKVEKQDGYIEEISVPKGYNPT